MSKRNAFVTGGTGYLGRPLISRLLERGHEVKALVRAGSEGKLPTGCEPVLGNALDAAPYANQIRPSDTFVQLVGVSHPNPSKAAQFRSVDLASATGAVQAAKNAGIGHFVYLSVAQPAPMNSVLASSPCMPGNRNQGRWVRTCVPAPRPRAKPRIIQAR